MDRRLWGWIALGVAVAAALSWTTGFLGPDQAQSERESDLELQCQRLLETSPGFYGRPVGTSRLVGDAVVGRWTDDTTSADPSASFTDRCAVQGDRVVSVDISGSR